MNPVQNPPDLSRQSCSSTRLCGTGTGRARHAGRGILIRGALHGTQGVAEV